MLKLCAHSYQSSVEMREFLYLEATRLDTREFPSTHNEN